MMEDPTKNVAFRLPESLLSLLDRYVEAMKAKQPGLKLTRADAVRVLLYRGLAEEGITSEGKP